MVMRPCRARHGRNINLYEFRNSGSARILMKVLNAPDHFHPAGELVDYTRGYTVGPLTSSSFPATNSSRPNNTSRVMATAWRKFAAGKRPYQDLARSPNRESHFFLRALAGRQHCIRSWSGVNYQSDVKPKWKSNSDNMAAVRSAKPSQRRHGRGRSGSDSGYCGLGEIFLRRGDRGEAERAFQSAASLDPNDSQARLKLGALCLAEGRRVEALREYQAGLKNDSDNRDALAAVGKLSSPVRAECRAKRRPWAHDASMASRIAPLGDKAEA